MKTHETAVVVIPPEDLWEPIQAIRRRYDRHTKEWMPHVNLLYPFQPRESFADIQPILERICASIAPFPVKVGAFRSFMHSPMSYTVWLAPEPPEALIDIQDALVEAIPECDDTSHYPGGYTPHLSLGQAHSRTQLHEMLALESGWKPLAFEVKSIALIARDPSGVFHVDRTVPFSTG